MQHVLELVVYSGGATVILDFSLHPVHYGEVEVASKDNVVICVAESVQ